jgi:hypothetical protein
MRGFSKFLGVVLSSSNEASIRRFIALLLVPEFKIGILLAYYLAYKHNNYNYLITGILAAAVPILLAYFLLTWQHIIEIVKNVDGIIPKGEKPVEEETPEPNNDQQFVQ